MRSVSFSLLMLLAIACGDESKNDTGVSEAADVDADEGADTDDTGTAVVDEDGDGFSGEDDCDDTDATVFSGATEVAYDGIDQDCDGADLTDVDGDGVDSVSVDGGTDCNDENDTVFPGADEIPYDGLDQDCDEADLTDVDGDGVDSVAVDGGADCNDDDAAIFPGADEICDGVDNDCDEETDEDDAIDATAWFADADEDTYGDAETTLTACAAPDGYVADSTDCNDTDASVSPGGTEVAYDGIDNDCLDGDLTDVDEDGFDSVAVEGGTDCNDDVFEINPGASEADDAIDNDCDVLVDEDFVAIGDIAVTEVMAQPGLGGFYGEWFEIHNQSDRDINLIGWTITDEDTDSIVIDTEFVIASGVYLVFAHSDYPELEVVVDRVYDSSDMKLADAADEVYVNMGDVVIGGIAYDTSVEGVSMGFGGDPIGADEDFQFWCAQSAEGGLAHTAGAANSACADFVCLESEVVTGDTWTGDLASATDDIDPVCGPMGAGSAGDETVAWAAEEDGCYRFAAVGTSAESVMHLNLSVIEACGATERECEFSPSSETGGEEVALTFVALADEMVQLHVDSWAGTDRSEYEASIVQADPAIAETGVPWTPDEEGGSEMTVSFADAVDQYTATCESDSAVDVVVEWTPSEDACFDILAEGGDTVLSINDGDACAHERACNDDRAGGIVEDALLQDVDVTSDVPIRIVVGIRGDATETVLKLSTCLE